MSKNVGKKHGGKKTIPPNSLSVGNNVFNNIISKYNDVIPKKEIVPQPPLVKPIINTNKMYYSERSGIPVFMMSNKISGGKFTKTKKSSKNKKKSLKRRKTMKN